MSEEKVLKVHARCAKCLVPMSMPLHEFITLMAKTASENSDRDIVIMCKKCGQKPENK